jgi:hypothetical protein
MNYINEKHNHFPLIGALPILQPIYRSLGVRAAPEGTHIKTRIPIQILSGYHMGSQYLENSPLPR